MTTHCDTTAMPHRETPVRLRELLRPGPKVFDYDAENRFFAKPVEEVKDYPWILDDLRLWVDEPEQKLEERDILEIGASEGALASKVVANFGPRRYIALDIIQRRLIGVGRLSRKMPALSPLSGSAFALPLKDEVVDVILNNGTLNHLPDLDTAVAEFARVLKPGGEYFGREPNGYNPAVRWVSAYSRASSPNAVPVLETRVRQAFESAGFVVETDYFWRRLPALNNRYLSVSLRIYARKGDRP